ncbi:MAG: superinfection immunity protein [Dehalococcoidia bacterium]
MKKRGLFATLGALYMLPSGIAFARKHRNREAVLALNIFTGWTIVGWCIALVWAIYRDPSSY